MPQLLTKLRSRFDLSHKRYFLSWWVNKPYRSNVPAIVIGGAERSGTTLLRAAIDSHPEIAAGPESFLFAYKPELEWLAGEYDIPTADVVHLRNESSCLAEFIERFFSEFCQREGKSIWCEKSPRNILQLNYVWRHFPKAKVVHIIRDGRDVACSLRHHPRHLRVGNEYIPMNTDRPISYCIKKWRRFVSGGLRHRGDERYMEVRYEDLVRDYEGTMMKVCRHCQVEWSPAVLEREHMQGRKQSLEIVNPEVRKPLYTSSVGRWKNELSEAEQRIVMRTGGQLLRKLGYLDGADLP